MIDTGMYLLVLLSLINFILAIGYRLRYEKELLKSEATSYQLERLVALEQIYGFFSIICLVIAVIASGVKFS